MLEFNFGNAFMHFARTGAPRGFTWKYLLSYIAVVIVYFVLIGALFGGLFFSLMTASVDPGATEELLLENAGAVVGMYGLMTIFGLLFYAIFEASYQRRYMHADTFKLRLAGDEFRLLVIYLLWFLFTIVMYLVSALLVVVGVQVNGVLAFLLGLVVVCGWIFLAVRLSAASALTVRDRKIRFASSWRVTRGRFWSLFGAHLAMFASAIMAYIVFAGILGIVMFATLANSGSDPDALASDPAFLVVMGIMYIFFIPAGAWFYYFWAGPAALAARTDPDSGGMLDPAEAFN